MASFTTRVELHDADSGDYDKLHKEMKKEGFSKEISSDDGITYELPPGEYNYRGSVKRADVREKAKSAAGRVKKEYSVVVTESAGRTWHGLDKVSK